MESVVVTLTPLLFLYHYLIPQHICVAAHLNTKTFFLANKPDIYFDQQHSDTCS